MHDIIHFICSGNATVAILILFVSAVAVIILLIILPVMGIYLKDILMTNNIY